MKDYADYDALGLAELVAKREVAPEELLDAALTRAEAAHGELNCFAHLFPDIAKTQIAGGLPDSPFKGVPFATKDLHAEIANAPLTNGSVAYKGNISTADCTLTERYRAAGLTLFGATTSPENGLTTSTESRLYGETRNPWNTARTSGGSSGGASAAVAAGVLPLAQASDGGGSIRIPAACTGLFGMKPSRGRIPMGPGRTEGWQGLSTVGAVSRSVRDSAALMDATHGPDLGARYFAKPPERSFLSELDSDPRPLKIALWDTAPNGITPDSDADAGLSATTKLLEALGHHIEPGNPNLDGEALGRSMVMNVAVHTALFFDARAAELGRPLREDEMETISARLAELGRTIPMTELARTDQAFMTAAIQFDTWMDAHGYDMILAPTLARKPDPLGVLSLSPEDTDAYTLAVNSFAPWCPAFNQMGAPAMSVPLHWTGDGLPLGMMFGARCGNEGRLFALAGQLERAAPWAGKRPPIFVG